ncbi:cytochrome P450 [Phascolomyces articulosus]|uniref:Cytochrome P450 n=1 Tax=Phascolomyces articulosus TaxID=60185 RepID=A0AAD5KJ57_9FUNG|nr:cytochrome P450 [Phascolomyces articulosus]
MSTSNNNGLLSTATIIGGTALGILSFLALKYPDCGVLEDVQKGIPQIKGYPLIGTFFQQLGEFKRIYDAQHEQLEMLNTMTIINSSIAIPLTITTIDPGNINYILRTNYTNYVKGYHFKNTMLEFFGDGLLVNDGVKWKYHRKRISKVFATQSLQKCFDCVLVGELKMITHQVLDRYASNGSVLDLQDILLKFTMNSIIRISLSKDLQILTQNQDIPFVESFDACVEHIVNLYLNPFTPIFDIVSTILHPRSKSIRQHYDTLHQFTSDIISERKRDIQDGKKFDDLLSRFMDNLDEDETTTYAITWTMYSLITNPMVENKLFAEIDTYFPNDGDSHQDDLDPVKLYDTIKNMKYAHAVFYEAMRLYPPTPLTQRVAVEDDTWPDGTEIRKGNMICCNIYAQARCSEIWGSDCHEFKPERWILEDGTLYKEEKGQWPVFIFGPRACLGKRLAIMKGLATLITLVRRYKFSLYKPDKKAEYEVGRALIIKGGLEVFVEKR